MTNDGCHPEPADWVRLNDDRLVIIHQSFNHFSSGRILPSQGAFEAAIKLMHIQSSTAVVALKHGNIEFKQAYECLVKNNVC